MTSDDDIREYIKQEQERRTMHAYAWNVAWVAFVFVGLLTLALIIIGTLA